MIATSNKGLPMNTIHLLKKRHSFNKIVEHIFYLSLVLLVSNYFFPFYFGVSDNREEIPALMFINGLGSYTNDEFIWRSVNEYNVATPYLYGLSFLTRNFGFAAYPTWFFTLHQLTLVSIFLSCKSIFYLLSPRLSYFYYFVSFTSLLLLLFKFPNIIFGGRWFVSNYFDPQFLAYPLCLASIYFFCTAKYYQSSLLLFLGNLLSPLLVNPIFLSYSLVLLVKYYFKDFTIFKVTRTGAIYFIAVVPYTAFLFFKTSSHGLLYNPQKIMTEVRATDLSRIPNIFDITGGDLYFFGFAIVLLSLTSIVFLNERKTSQKFRGLIEKNFNTTFVLFCFFIICFLGVSSIVSSFITFSLLYRLDPFRISVILVPIVFLFLASYFFRSVKLPFVVLSFYKFAWPVALILVVLQGIQNSSQIALKTDGDENNYASYEKFIDAKEMISWIRANTSKTDTFLNYADSKNFVTLRTHAFRSTFFFMENY